MFKIDDGSVIEFPGVCSICGSSPTKDEFTIDTEVKYVDDKAKHLIARKYVCQLCAEEIAKLVPSTWVDKLESETKRWKAEYGKLVAALDTLTSEIMRVND